MRQKVMIGMLALAAILLARNLYVISTLPDEVNQGQIFRIIFFHVPAAIAAMTGSAVALVASVLFLIKKDFFYDSLAVAVTEVGLALSFGASGGRGIPG
jgi:heme exporter protein C